ncbi:MAG TPA: hypothetical protein VM536_05075, partial [Chloroflexia bacterium]|nr:hypothetical protein [Chloroflexia bacterium]
MYETVQHASFDYNKLLRIMGQILPIGPDVTGADIEGMEYDEARQYFGDMAAAEFDRQFSGRLAEAQQGVRTAALRGDVVRQVEGSDAAPLLEILAPLPEADREASLLLELIDRSFPLVPASAVTRLPIDPNSSMGGAELPRLVAAQLEQIYNEVQDRLGRDFLAQNGHVPLLGLVDHSIPANVYREMEETLGAEELEAVELTPVGTLDGEVRDLVREAFVKHQESRWILHVIDQLWTRHLTTMEGLRQSIGLQAYAQKDPLIEYKRTSYELFEELKGEIRQLGTRVLSLRIEPAEAPPAPRKEAPRKEPDRNQAAALAAVAGVVGTSAGNGGNGGNAAQHKGQQLPRGKRGGKEPARVPATVGA